MDVLVPVVVMPAAVIVISSVSPMVIAAVMPVKFVTSVVTGVSNVTQCMVVIATGSHPLLKNITKHVKFVKQKDLPLLQLGIQL